jgi:hypothetical protein
MSLTSPEVLSAVPLRAILPSCYRQSPRTFGVLLGRKALVSSLVRREPCFCEEADPCTTAAGGEGDVAMRNERGVTIYLVSVEEGVKTTIGGAGVEIKLRP